MNKLGLTHLIFLAGAVVGAGCSSDASHAGGLDGSVMDAASAGNCLFGEPNNVREMATVVNLNQTYAGICVGGEADPVDFFQIAAPATDLAGGYVQVQVRNVVGASSEFLAQSVSDNGQVLDVYTTTDGANLDGWFTVAPGAKYRVAIQRFAGVGATFTYDIQFKYTALVDAFEPNNTRETAKPILVGTPIMASAAVAALGADVADNEKTDWYSVTLAAGTATVTMSNVPADYLCDITLMGPEGALINEKYSTSPGANCQAMFTELAAGSYSIKSEQFAGPPDRAHSGAILPQSLTGQYTLAVTQP